MPGGLLPSASQQVCVPAPRPGPGTTPPHMYLPGHCLLLRQLSTCLGLNKWRYILYTLYSSKLEIRFLWFWCFSNVVVILFDFILYECLNVYSLFTSLSLKSQYQGRCHNQTISTKLCTNNHSLFPSFRCCEAFHTLFLNGECFKWQEQQLKHWQFKCALCSSSTFYDFKMMHLEGHFMFHSWIA